MFICKTCFPKGFVVKTKYIDFETDYSHGCTDFEVIRERERKKDIKFCPKCGKELEK